MTSDQCPFCQFPELHFVAENALVFAIWDKFPARPLHTLIIPKRHVSDIFQTNAEEREAVHQLAAFCCKLLIESDPSIGGFNFGSNVGVVAGQKLFHAHIHLIPRRLGEQALPPAHPDPGRNGGQIGGHA